MSMKKNVVSAIGAHLVPALQGGKSVTAGEVAYAAIAAMLEPTEAMVEAAAEATNPKDAWRLMIKAALEGA